MSIAKAPIGNAVESVAPDHVVTTADQIYDEALGKYQSEINQEGGGGGGDVNGVKVGNNTYTPTQGSGGIVEIPSYEQGAEPNVQSDWNESDSTKDAFIKNKPTIPAAQIQSDWEQSNSSAKDFIKNKPTIPAAQIQSDWNQSDTDAKDFIKNKPTIPAAQIQSDWNQTNTEAKDFIKNKPTIPSGVSPYDENPQMDGQASSGSSTNFARGDHRHPSDTSKQDTLVFNTPYNASTNKVATMADIQSVGLLVPLAALFENSNMLSNPFFDGSTGWNLTDCTISDGKVNINGKGWAKQTIKLEEMHKYLAVAFVKIDSLNNVTWTDGYVNYAKTGIGFRIKDATTNEGSYFFNIDSISMLRPMYYTPVVYTFIAYMTCDPEIFFGEMYDANGTANGSIAHAGLYDITDVTGVDTSYKSLFFIYKEWVEQKTGFHNPIRTVVYPDTLACEAFAKEVGKNLSFYRMCDTIYWVPSGISEYLDQYNDGNTYLTEITPSNINDKHFISAGGSTVSENELCIWEYNVNSDNVYVLSGVNVTYPNKVVIVTYWGGANNQEFRRYSEDFFRPVRNYDGATKPEIYNTDRLVMIPKGCSLIKVNSNSGSSPVLKCYSEAPIYKWQSVGTLSGASGTLNGTAYTKETFTYSSAYTRFVFDVGNPFNDGDVIKLDYSTKYHGGCRIYFKGSGSLSPVDLVSSTHKSTIVFTYKAQQSPYYLLIQMDNPVSKGFWDGTITVSKQTSSTDSVLVSSDYEFRLKSNRSSCRDLCILEGYAASYREMQEIWNMNSKFSTIYDVNSPVEYRQDVQASRTSLSGKEMDKNWFTICGKPGSGFSREVTVGSTTYTENKEEVYALCAKNRTNGKWFSVSLARMDYLPEYGSSSEQQERKAFNTDIDGLLLKLLQWGNGEYDFDTSMLDWDSCCVYEVQPDIVSAFDDVDQATNMSSNITKFYATWKGKNERMLIHPYSSIKMLTSIIALKHLKPSDIVQVISNDFTKGSGFKRAKTSQSDQVAWESGDFLEVREAIHELLSNSDNTITTALARCAGYKILDSRNSFVIDKV